MSNAAVIITAACGAIVALLTITASITGQVAKARAEQSSAHVAELREALEFERKERQVERRKCEQDIAQVRSQLAAAVSTWAQNLAPTLAAELRPYLAEIIRESR